MMSTRRKILALILILFILMDGIAIIYIWQSAKTPSVDKVTGQATITPLPATSPVLQRKDHYFQSFSLNGEWLYLQTGSEDADYIRPSTDLTLWRKMNLP